MADNGTKWEFEGDYLQACSCDYGCPCEFEAPPTKGFCEGLGAWRINKGRYGDVSLDGLGLGFSARWPQAIHLGNGNAVVFIDERANAQQRDALTQIASGAAGGMPFEIIVTTLSKVDIQFVPFEFNINGSKSSAKMGSAATMSFEAIKNPAAFSTGLASCSRALTSFRPRNAGLAWAASSTSRGRTKLASSRRSNTVTKPQPQRLKELSMGWRAAQAANSVRSA